jgi:hypothetical protein
MRDDLPRALQAFETAKRKAVQKAKQKSKRKGKQKGKDDCTHLLSPRRCIPGTPADALEAAREKLLAALMPSGVPHIHAGGDADITNSELDYSQIAILQDLRRLLLPQGWHQACGDRRYKTILDLEAWLQRLDPLPWDGSELKDLQPLPRRLLKYMWRREQAHISDLIEEVWDEDLANVKDTSIQVAVHKVNDFLLKREHPKSLSMIRGESVIRWQ